MRRISTSTRVIDKFGAGKDGFTNGDAVSGLPSTDLEDVWFDHVQEEIASVVEGAGFALDTSNRAQLIAAIKQLAQGGAGLTPPVGSMANGTVLLTAASNSLTFKADQVIVGTAINGLAYTVPNVNLTINTSTVGANGMNTGSPAVSGFVAVYLLYNPTTGAKALLGVNEVSINVPPMVFAGTGIPAGYTANCLIGSYWTNASGQFQPCMQAGRRIWNGGAATISGAGVATLAGTVWPAVPNAAKAVSGNINITNSGASADAVTVFPLSTGGPGYKNHNRNSPAGGSAACFSDLPINPGTPRTSYYSIQATGGSINVSITSTDYLV
ncbi:phage tail protein (plasmid) [Paraburkholderia strydomiana]